MEKENVLFVEKRKNGEGKGIRYVEKEIAFWPRRRRGASCEPRWLRLYSETKEAYKHVILSTQSEN